MVVIGEIVFVDGEDLICLLKIEILLILINKFEVLEDDDLDMRVLFVR